ncbi:keratin, type I cytoskeletal 19-like [Spea bombifrons]|uniref:keratin, type I cytoskeletal 19-like n=1 Tax=Spea bombifrons TaxID=233779 RepID=UPI00234B36A3|nr:keratin, type I cytoskeletal 19-like [Spea bombifrons]
MSHSVKQMHSGSVKGSSQVSSTRHSRSHSSHHGGFQKVHQVVNHRAPSVHGGSGGKGISISRHYASSVGCSSGFSHADHFGSQRVHGGWKNDGMFCFNEKETMHLLNDRLASYLEKVCSLEQENSQLERNIREWYEKHQPHALPDFSKFFKMIKDLQSQIAASYAENAKIFLQLDNAKLAADDFRNKYEIEQGLRSSIEADVQGLRRVLERLNMERSDLEIQAQCLQEELQQMKKNHEEEVNCLKAQLGMRVNVEVDAAPSVDLNKVLSEIRQQYENSMEKNLREVESIFLARSEELNREVVSGSEQLQSVNNELIELRRTLQTLEIELHSQLSLKSALEGTLAETEASYSSQLSQLQDLINHVECQLTQVRSDLEQQNYEYKILMDQKTHLEMEIATYKRLLEGHDFHVTEHGHHEKNERHQSVKIQQTTERVHQTTERAHQTTERAHQTTERVHQTTERVRQIKL